MTKARNPAHSVMGEVCGIQRHLRHPSGGVLPSQGIVGGSPSIKLCSGRKEEDVSVGVHAEHPGDCPWQGEGGPRPIPKEPPGLREGKQ